MLREKRFCFIFANNVAASTPRGFAQGRRKYFYKTSQILTGRRGCVGNDEEQQRRQRHQQSEATAFAFHFPHVSPRKRDAYPF